MCIYIHTYTVYLCMYIYIYICIVSLSLLSAWGTPRPPAKVSAARQRRATSVLAP